MSKRVLGVGAHPDDLEWFAGGTIARLAQEGAEIFSVVCTNGEKGSYDPGADPNRLATIRQAEQHEAARWLGVREVLFLDYADGDLASSPALTGQLVRLYRTYRPDLLLAFDPWKPYELHPDHLAAGRAALDARIGAKMPLYYPELRGEGLEAWAIPEIWLFNPGMPNHYVDVEHTAEVQLKALAAHRSQTTVWNDAARAFIETTLRERGEKGGAKYAEAFRRLVIEDALILAQGTSLHSS
jgi:LmbE family N-acetylglucosaminyl deacetylase